MRLGRLACVVAALVVFGCGGKKEQDPGERGATAAPVETTADGKRKLAITVSKRGYEPGSLSAPAGAPIVLEFTRVEETECGRYIKVADGEPIELPLDQPVEVAVDMPTDADLRFACGMDMFTGVVKIAEK